MAENVQPVPGAGKHEGPLSSAGKRLSWSLLLSEDLQRL